MIMHNHSFAIMAYGDSPYLEECLISLRAQTIQSNIYIATSTPSEYIDVLAKKYDVQVYNKKTKTGIADDWNFSLAQATTKYVTLAHQDDLYLADYTKECINAAEVFHDTLICFTDYSEVSEGKERKGTLLLRVKLFMLWFFMPFRKNISSKFWKSRFLSFGCPVAAPSVMYNRDKINQFKFSTDFTINMDWDAWSRMAQQEGRFVYVNRNLVQHRIHEDSATTIGLQANARQSEDMIMFNRYWPAFIANILGGIYSSSYKSNG
jgi:GT2 family glycosyltransferase